MAITSLNNLKPFDLNYIASGELGRGFDSIINSLLESERVLANLEASDTGKSIDESSNEIKVVLDHFKYARELLKKREIKINEALNSLEKEIPSKPLEFITLPVPKGLIALILPYNFPAVVLSERLPYMLAAGNAVIVKPSEVAYGAVPEIVKIIKSILGEHAIDLCLGDSSVGKELVNSEKIKMVSFTGSTQQGVAVAEACSKQLKPYSLELGGNNLAIIDSKEDFYQALNHCINGITYHSGQCCISTRKILLRKGLSFEFEALLRDELIQMVSDGAIRPLTSSLSSYHEFISSEESKLCKHRVINENGPDVFIYKNQIISDLDEIFGPVIFINEYESDEDLYKILDEQDYGLALQIFSTSNTFIRSIIEKAEVGRIWINSSLVSNPSLRIGGYKKSGNCWIGGELALYDYSNFKALTIEGSYK